MLLYTPFTLNKSFLSPYEPQVTYTPNLERYAELWWEHYVDLSWNYEGTVGKLGPSHLEEAALARATLVRHFHEREDAREGLSDRRQL